MDRVTIAGAGLVGSLLSLFLARKGYRVEVFERRPDMRKGRATEGRSINLAISERGLHALRQVGLEAEALRHAIPMRGRMMHPVKGALAFQAYGKDDSQCINSISRGYLNEMLMSAAETGGVELSFGHRLSGVDWESSVVRFQEEGKSTERRVGPTVLIGADGGGSSVRQEMMKLPRHVAHQDVLSHGYKELNIPAGPGGVFQMEKHALHIWPRGAFMLIALPNEDGSFTCTLFLSFKGAVSFESLHCASAVQEFFEREFPDALALIPDLTAQFAINPTGSMATLKCDPWNVGGQALLVGDAAHAVVPFYGQGMNCGFEDCVALDALLPLGFERAFANFSQTRKPQADAIADMAVENFVEMRDKVADPRFLLEKQIEKRLLNAFPGEFLSRYTLVSFSLAPYRFAARVGEIAGEIIRELAEGATRAEDINLDRAGQLIRDRLVPYVKDNEYGFRA